MDNFIPSSPVESLLDGSTGVWDVLNINRQQAAFRRKLRESLDHFDHASYELYELLNELLSSGEDDRFILYCPLELVPNASWYRQLDDSVDTFIELYLQAWWRLLEVQDPRGDFTDGDVPETELSPTDLVVQATRLAPTLTKKGLITADSRIGRPSITHHTIDIPFFDLHEFVVNELYDSTDYRGIDERRVKWLRADRHKKIIESIGNSLGAQIEILPVLPWPASADLADVMIVAIRSAIEQAYLRGAFHEAFDLYRKFEYLLLRLLRENGQREATVKAFCRLHSIGIVKKEMLEELDIFFPNLGGPFRDNLARLGDGRSIASEILRDPKLAKVAYPVSIAYGSTLKGYGFGSDIDRAIFIRPGCDHSVHQLLQSKLGSVVEYWLEEDGADLRIQDFPEEDKAGFSANVHVLFTGMWEGDPETLSMLGERLLKPYLRSKDSELRKLWMRELERGILQYRLLHRGYETFYVPRTKEVFFDEGYRWMAAELYASYIWLPDNR